MGFSKAKGVDDFVFSKSYTVENDKGQFEDVMVSHTFRIPTADERDEYEQKSMHLRGKKLTHKVSTAKLWLWGQCCLRVKGYDDLPKDTAGKLDPAWKQKYFANDPKVLLHCDQFTGAFLEFLEGEGVELEKN